MACTCCVFLGLLQALAPRRKAVKTIHLLIYSGLCEKIGSSIYTGSGARCQTQILTDHRKYSIIFLKQIYFHEKDFHVHFIYCVADTLSFKRDFQRAGIFSQPASYALLTTFCYFARSLCSCCCISNRKQAYCDSPHYLYSTCAVYQFIIRINAS